MNKKVLIMLWLLIMISCKHHNQEIEQLISKIELVKAPLTLENFSKLANIPLANFIPDIGSSGVTGYKDISLNDNTKIGVSTTTNVNTSSENILTISIIQFNNNEIYRKEFSGHNQ